jgi:hypothetical protein
MCRCFFSCIFAFIEFLPGLAQARIWETSSLRNLVQENVFTFFDVSLLLLQQKGLDEKGHHGAFEVWVVRFTGIS